MRPQSRASLAVAALFAYQTAFPVVAEPSLGLQDSLLFANADDLFTCMGLVSAPETPFNLTLQVVDCEDPLVHWSRSLDNASDRAPLSVFSQSADREEYWLVPGVESLTGTGPYPVQVSNETTEGQWTWAIDGLLRLVLRPWKNLEDAENTTANSTSDANTASDSDDDDDPDKWCLARYTEEAEETTDTNESNESDDSNESDTTIRDYYFTTSSIVLARCDSETYLQKWISLPRGLSDPNANLWDVNFPLRRSGRRLFDASGRVVRLRGVNWYGAHTESGVNNGLDKMPIANITRLMRHLGFNHVRMNYAVEMWVDRHKNVTAKSFLLTANPELKGKTEFEVFDALVKAITAEGLMVIINAHTSDKRWCCSITDDQGLWYNDRWSEEDWLDSLQGLAAHYADDPRVIGYDIRNEPRPDETTLSWIWWNTHIWGNCTEVSLYSNGEPLLKFGSFSEQGICLPEWSADWRAGAEQGSYAVWHGDPDAIVFVEGLGAATLVDIKASPMRFSQDCLDSRIVWSIHEYTWTWRFLRLFGVMTTGGTGTSLQDLFETLANIYRDEDPNRNDWDTFVLDRYNSYAFFLEEQTGSVWIGEFGENGRSDWWLAYMKYSKEMDLDWTYWSFDGYKYAPGVEVDPSYMASNQKFDLPGGIVQDYVPEPYGILEPDYKAVHHPWKLADIIALQAPVVSDDITIDPRTWEECVFDPVAQPVKGTGAKPTMFDDFLSKPDVCTEDAGRRLNEDFARVLGESDAASEEEIESDDVTTAAETAESTEETVAAIAQQRQEAACSASPSMYAALSEKERAAAREIVENNQVGGKNGENPVDLALRSSTPAETKEKFQEIANEEADSLRMFGYALAIGLPLTMLLVLVSVCCGRNGVSRNKWGQTLACLCWPCRLFPRSCCRCCKGPENMAHIVPPLKSKIAQATASAQKWQPVFLVLYVALTLGTITAGTWALRGSMLVNRGMSRFRCATLRGIDETLNGVSDAGEGTWAGLLPALAHLQNLTATISHNSGAWNLVRHLIEDLEVLPTQLQALETVLEGVSDAYGETCPMVDHEVLVNASHHVEWSLAHGFELGYEQLLKLESKWDNAVQEVRSQLVATSDGLTQARDFIMGHFAFFYKNDPIGWGSQAVELGALGLLLLFFIVMVPMLLLSSAAMAHIICCTKGQASMLGAASEPEVGREADGEVEMQGGGARQGADGDDDSYDGNATLGRFGNLPLPTSACSSAAPAAASPPTAAATAVAHKAPEVPNEKEVASSSTTKGVGHNSPDVHGIQFGPSRQIFNLDDFCEELPPPKPPNERQPQDQTKQQKQHGPLDFAGIVPNPSPNTSTLPSLLPSPSSASSAFQASPVEVGTGPGLGLGAMEGGTRTRVGAGPGTGARPGLGSVHGAVQPGDGARPGLGSVHGTFEPGDGGTDVSAPPSARPSSASLTPLPLPAAGDTSGWTFHDSPMSKRRRLGKTQRCQFCKCCSKCCRIGPFRCCGRRCGQERSARDAFIRSIVASPRAAFFMWVTGLFFALITLATSAWLRSAVAPLASACVVFDGLTSESLLVYSKAVGLPLKSSSVGVAATGIIAECLTESGHDGLADMFDIETCPAGALPEDINGTLQEVNKWGRKRLNSLLRVKEKSRLETDTALLTLLSQLRGGLADDTSCAFTDETSDALLDSLLEACNSTGACGVTEWPETDDPEEYGNITAQIFSELSLLVDQTVDRSTDTLVEDVVVTGIEDFLSNFEEISTMLDCSFLRSIWELTKDSVCYEVVVGLIHLRDTLFALGLLCLTMSVVMYCLWFRLSKHRAIVREHWDSRKRSESCGRPINFSAISRRLALGELLELGRSISLTRQADSPRKGSKSSSEHSGSKPASEPPVSPNRREEASPRDEDQLETGRIRL